MRRFETFGRTAGASFAFYVLKELSHSNGSSEAQRWLLPKCGRLCRPLPKRGGPRLISAALEDTTVTLLVGSTLAISQTSNPQRHPLCNIRKRLLPSTAFPLVQRLEMQRRGNYSAFRCFSISLSSNACNIMFHQGCDELLIPAQQHN